MTQYFILKSITTIDDIKQIYFVLDQYATVGISRSQVDNRELVESWSYNMISEIDCVPPDPQNIDTDLTLGQVSKNRYSKGMWLD